MANSRRQVLALFLTGAAFSAGLSKWLRNRPTPMQFQPLPGVEGFRYLDAGASSGGLPDPFIGLDHGGATAPEGSLNDLFTEPAAPEIVPVASFSDYNCPYCRILTKILAQEVAGGGIAVTWHELPLLGPSSVVAARAALAAGMQSAYLPMHERLMQTRFRPTPTWLESVADELNLDAVRLLEDMESARVSEQLRRSAGVAGLLGIYGTPALVVGRTLVLGEINRADLRRLIELERE